MNSISFCEDKAGSSSSLTVYISDIDYDPTPYFHVYVEAVELLCDILRDVCEPDFTCALLSTCLYLINSVSLQVLVTVQLKNLFTEPTPDLDPGMFYLQSTGRVGMGLSCPLNLIPETPKNSRTIVYFL